MYAVLITVTFNDRLAAVTELEGLGASPVCRDSEPATGCRCSEQGHVADRVRQRGLARAFLAMAENAPLRR